MSKSESKINNDDNAFNTFVSPRILTDDIQFAPEVLRSDVPLIEADKPLFFTEKTSYDWSQLIQRVCEELEPQGQPVYQNSASILRCTYFSQRNIDILQKYIKYTTYKASNSRFRISNQPENVILQYMHEIYDAHARELDEIHMSSAELRELIPKEVKRLNMFVIDVCVRCIIDSIEGDLNFHKFINEKEMIVERVGSRTNTITGENDVVLT